MQMKKMNISPPWVTYYYQLVALFKEDADVNVTYDEDSNVISVYVEGQDKADALTQLLPDQKVFGNVVVSIKVIPANSKTTRAELIKKAFDGNPVFSYATTVEGIMVNPITYVVFVPKVAQYWADSLHDPHGLVSTLYEDLAREIIGEGEGICFSTDALEAQAVG